ncbi:transposase-like zinc-binding domain-containing protein [Neosynechococcus sphagnicola]
MPVCPSGASSHRVKNGHIHNGKQRFKCHDCGRQFYFIHYYNASLLA